MATSQPSWIIAAICQHVSPAAMYWSRTVWWYRSLIRELPPMATTALRLAMERSAHRECQNGLLAVQTILRLVVHGRLGTVDDRVRYLDVPIGRKWMHEDGVIVGHCHPAVVGDPVLVLVDDL